ncbi:MAG: alpha/beta fold hydrolase [Paracoccaceae bacterium]|nr:alpha/beta fold hydrolase [Paracoccaceae bacterium]MDH5530517.1 alpha/beta fold hydrolase [Paracoccaceae bacterium]
MARFLFIHGSCHGAWCWRDLLPLLQEEGHEARAIDLPAHGQDVTPAAEVTLDLYADAILAAIDAPAILVGHSAAGYPITLAAERAPAKIAQLIYLCAYVPAPGRSMIDLRRIGPRQPLAGVFRRDPSGLTYSVDTVLAGEAFYHDCTEEILCYSLPRLCPEPIAPQSTPLPPLTHWGDIPKHYILCENDQTIAPEYQAAMTADWPDADISRLPSGHSPFFSAPEMLARRLSYIASEESRMR